MGRRFETARHWVPFFAAVTAVLLGYALAARTSRWLALAYVTLGVCAAVVWWRVSRRKRDERRRRYWAAKAPMSDADFLTAVAAESRLQQEFCLQLRSRMVEELSVAAELVQPGDLLTDYLELDYLPPLLCDGCDVMKNRLGLKPDTMFVLTWVAESSEVFLGCRTLGDYFRFHLEHWEEILAGSDEVA